MDCFFNFKNRKPVGILWRKERGGEGKSVEEKRREGKVEGREGEGESELHIAGWDNHQSGTALLFVTK